MKFINLKKMKKDIGKRTYKRNVFNYNIRKINIGKVHNETQSNRKNIPFIKDEEC